VWAGEGHNQSRRRAGCGYKATYEGIPARKIGARHTSSWESCSSEKKEASPGSCEMEAGYLSMEF